MNWHKDEPSFLEAPINDHLGGVTSSDWQKITTVFRQNPSIQEVILFGSRAK